MKTYTGQKSYMKELKLKSKNSWVLQDLNKFNKTKGHMDAVTVQVSPTQKMESQVPRLKRKRGK